MTRSEIAAMLREGICRVEFVKKDGTIRVMLATLEESKLPPSVGSGRVSPETTLPVFDVEADAWRSFIVANVISVTPVEE